MATTPSEIDAAGQATVDLGGRTVHIARWLDDTYEGRALTPGRWYNLMHSTQSIGMIDVADGEVYAFRPYAVGQALGRVFPDFSSALRYLGGSQST
jgi:hypothetical protein